MNRNKLVGALLMAPMTVITAAVLGLFAYVLSRDPGFALTAGLLVTLAAAFAMGVWGVELYFGRGGDDGEK
jgi:hypothetical protein